MSDDIEDIQQALEKKLLLPKVKWGRPITHEDIAYLLAHCPFLQIVNVNAGESDSLPKPRLIRARSGWIIHYYGDAMSSSPGEWLLGGGDFRMLLGDQAQNTAIINPGKGTIHKQAFDTAQEMIELVKQYGWPGIRIVDGHPSMRWAAWMKATDEEMSLTGYAPTPEEEEKRALLKRPPEEDQVIQQAPKPPSVPPTLAQS